MRVGRMNSRATVHPTSLSLCDYVIMDGGPSSDPLGVGHVNGQERHDIRTFH
jgi:hypothetical protein